MQKKGIILHSEDLLIGATAKHLGLAVATQNRQDFLDYRDHFAILLKLNGCIENSICSMLHGTQLGSIFLLKVAGRCARRLGLRFFCLCRKPLKG